jgi:hypothetical protein
MAPDVPTNHSWERSLQIKAKSGALLPELAPDCPPPPAKAREDTVSKTIRRTQIFFHFISSKKNISTGTTPGIETKFYFLFRLRI